MTKKQQYLYAYRMLRTMRRDSHKRFGQHVYHQPTFDELAARAPLDLSLKVSYAAFISYSHRGDYDRLLKFNNYLQFRKSEFPF